MNIEDLTVDQAREIASLFNRAGNSTTDIAGGMIGKYCVVRTYSAGVHAGILESRSGREVMLKDSRRIWHWKGAASLSQLAQSGTTSPNGCKFSVPIQSILLTESIEVIPCTTNAEGSLRGVPEWTA